MGERRTTLRLSDERRRLIEQATEIVRLNDADDPPVSVVLDAALTHLLQSHRNLVDHRSDYPPETVKALCNTDVLGMEYRTAIISRWRG